MLYIVASSTIDLFLREHTARLIEERLTAQHRIDRKTLNRNNQLAEVRSFLTFTARANDLLVVACRDGSGGSFARKKT